MLYQRSTRRCSGNHFFHDTFHSSQKNLISQWNCRFTNFDRSFEKHHSIFVNIHIYCFEYPSRFRLQLQGEGTYQKKLDEKTFLFSTEDDVYSGDLYSGNDGYSGLNPPDDAILFTVSGITAIADKKFEILIKEIEIFILFFMVIDAELSRSHAV